MVEQMMEEQTLLWLVQHCSQGTRTDFQSQVSKILLVNVEWVDEEMPKSSEVRSLFL